MNKKRLSVVMAGAMLATSVAPVMAAETETKTLSVSQLAIYANTIKEKMEANKIDTENHKKIYGEGTSATEFLSAEVAEVAKNFSGKSVYGVKINGGNVKYDVTGGDTGFNAIKSATPGTKIEIVKYATTDFHGLLIPGSEIKTLGTDDTNKYTEDDFTRNFETPRDGLKAKLEASDYIKSAELNEDKKSATVTLEALDENGKNKTITIAVGEAELDLELPMSGEKLLTEKVSTVDSDNIQKCDGFMRVQKWDLSDKVANPETVVETINVVADEDPTIEKLDVKDLYDGTILTSRGTEILNDLKNDKLANSGTSKYVKLVDDGNNGVDSLNGVNTFEVQYFVKGNAKAIKTIKISSTKLADATALYNLLKGNTYTVGVVGGSNRYATAVNVAKEQGVELDITNNKHVVLVNGSALVDGLAAAPLAAVINGKEASKSAAPILLSKADSLPKETKDYLNEITSKLSMKQRKEITITLVGGESVLNDSLVEELKNMGFKVDRLGGDNREATSLEVAEAIGTTNTAFVVGANGEADAMSISAVAARDLDSAVNKQVTPIIVSKAGGISKDALKFLSKQNGDAFIIGGESVVSKEDEAKINEAKSEYDYSQAIRISGENRFETNAKIIEKYYKQIGDRTDAFNGNYGVEAIIVAKDGQSNKDELIDALSAANYAASKNAPIVLATNSLNVAQKNALLKIDTEKHIYDNSHKLVNSLEKAVQVGNGAEKSVLETVAKLFGLSNK